MKRFFVFAIILSSLSLPAFAAKNSQDVAFSRAVKIGSTQVAAGAYKVTWTGTDSNTQVTITQNKKVIVTVPAKIVAAKNGSVSVSTKTVNGAEVLETIQLDKLNLVLTGSESSGQ